MTRRSAVRIRRWLFFAVAFLTGAGWLAADALPARGAEPAPLMLVTPEEAALPALTTVGGGDLSDGPEIRVESPEAGGVYAVGFPVSVLFLVGESGQAVNQDSLKVIYKKAWGIDITSRIRDYVGPEGIHVPSADFPPGEHTVQIYIEDVEANASTRRLTVTVAKE